MVISPAVKKFLWDVNTRELDLQEHRGFIITRLTEKGDWPAVRWLKKQYGLAAIKQVVARSKNTSLKTKSFWKIA